jgi:hypothetical protein
MTSGMPVFASQRLTYYEYQHCQHKVSLVSALLLMQSKCHSAFLASITGLHYKELPDGSTSLIFHLTDGLQSSNLTQFLFFVNHWSPIPVTAHSASAAARLPGLQVRIPPGAWMSVST